RLLPSGHRLGLSGDLVPAAVSPCDSAIRAGFAYKKPAGRETPSATKIASAVQLCLLFHSRKIIGVRRERRWVASPDEIAPEQAHHFGESGVQPQDCTYYLDRSLTLTSSFDHSMYFCISIAVDVNSY